MENILNLKIYTPEKLIINEVIKKISINGREGNYTILPNHIDYLSSFDNSIVKFVKNNDEIMILKLRHGAIVKCDKELQISVFEVDDNKNFKIENCNKDFNKKLKNTLNNIGIGIFNKNIKI